MKSNIMSLIDYMYEAITILSKYYRFMDPFILNDRVNIIVLYSCFIVLFSLFISEFQFYLLFSILYIQYTYKYKANKSIWKYLSLYFLSAAKNYQVSGLYYYFFLIIFMINTIINLNW